MNCSEVYLDDPNECPADWLETTRAQLLEKWISTTKHAPKSGAGTWACEIASGCRTCNEHLSLPCSLLSEANEIGTFLSASCFTSDPAIFFRLYLIILSEFVAQLEDASDLMKLGLRKKPRRISLWANRWAKHRLMVLLQHHPLMVFADQYGEAWPIAANRYRLEPFTDACGNIRPLRIIDEQWLENICKPSSVITDANGPEQVLIFVPSFSDFVDEAIGYFREFVDACLKDPDRIRRFESSHYVKNC